MNLIEFGAKALPFAKLQPTMGEDMIHASLGITSDLGELIECVCNHTLGGDPLDRTNFIEEAGDVLWFVNLMATCLDRPLDRLRIEAIEGINIVGVRPIGIEDQNAWLVIASAQIADKIKAHMIYGKPLDAESVERATGYILLGIETLASAWDIPLEEILDANIAKLTARYGAKYDQERALNRDKGAEREAIEAAVA